MFDLAGERGGARTHDPVIKSQLHTSVSGDGSYLVHSIISFPSRVARLKSFAALVKRPILRSTVLATVNDAFGAASRSLARSLTVAPHGAWDEVGRDGETAPLAEQRNAGDARLISGPNLVPSVWNEVFCWWLRMGLLGAANRSRAAPLAKSAACVAKERDVCHRALNACGAYPVAAAHQGLKAAESDSTRAPA